MMGRIFVGTVKNVRFWLIFGFIFTTALRAHAATVNYTLDNVMMSATQQMTGTFSWTYFGDFESGVGQWSSLSIPWTSHGQNDLNTTFEPTSSIEITLAGNYHDDGVDITLFLLQPLTPTTSASLDLVRSKYDIGGNGFHAGPFLSGSISPSFVSGDFDYDGDVDGVDFLKWQRGESPYYPLSATDLAAWEANFGTGAAAASVAVPEPSAILLCVMAAVGLFVRKRRHAGCRCRHLPHQRTLLINTFCTK